MRILKKFLSIYLVWALLTPAAWAEEQAHAAEIPTPAGEIVRKVEDKVTLELQAVSIFDVFKILSKKSGLNIVAGKNVQGQVSIFLQDVPVREALRTILQSQGLASVDESGIIKVITEEDFLKKYGRPYEDTRIAKSFNIIHASVEMLAAKLAELKSPYGKIITEVRTNTLSITELPKILDEMEKLISESDQEQAHAVFRLNYTKVEDLEPKLKSFAK